MDGGGVTAADQAATAFACPRHARLWPAVVARLPPGEMAHDQHHLVRVYRWALRLAPEAGADADLAGATALVHDLAFVAKDSPDRALGGERSATAAPVVLAAAGYLPDEIAAISSAVRTSSWSRGLAPENALGVVLQDADRLDALGAIGLLRTAACGQFMASAERPGRFYDPLDPLAASARALDDRTQVVDHLYAKLFRLAAGMHLPTAKVEAERRNRFLHAFVAQLQHEVAPV
jgi:uncharacterized protein